MEMASRSDRGFTDEDDEDEDYGRRDGSSSRRESNAKSDGRNNGEQRAISPRSKHSATEQRRRSKINDRFRILRELIPHTDQKRDKASFLLEVIEYIQFLHEKVQKYETTFPGWNNDNSKLVPWKTPQMSVKAVGDPSPLMQNGPSAGYLVSGDNAASTATTMLTNGPVSLDPDNVNPGIENKEAFSGLLQQYASDVGFTQSPQAIISNPDNMASHSHSQWLRSCTTPAYMLNNQGMVVDDGTISISTPYSQGLLQALAQTLQDCGIDLSQSSISVQINLGKRAFCRSDSNRKEHIEDPSAANQVIGLPQMGSNDDESDPVMKKHKADNNEGI